MTHLYFYKPATEDRAPHVVDVAVLNADGERIGLYSRMTESELAAEHPGMGLETTQGLEKLMLDFFRRPVQEIDADLFEQQLEVLPPEDWQVDSFGESFKLAEHLSGSITHIYARVGRRYFAMTDDAATPHAEIMARVLNFMETTK